MSGCLKMIENGDAHSHILSLINDRGFQNETAQIRSKALLREIAEEEPPLRWRYMPRRVVRNLVSATFELENLARLEPQQIVDLRKEASRMAATWESLAKLEEGVTRDTAFVNAAVNYELAGYQANAAHIASRIVPSVSRFERPSLTDLCALFIQRRFLQLKDVAEAAKIEPETDDQVEVSLAAALAVAYAADSLSADRRYPRAVLRLRASGTQTALQNSAEHESPGHGYDRVRARRIRTHC